jgi:polar amino acid transport system permease protein
MSYDWDFSVVWPYLPVFLSGLWITIGLSALTILLGTAAGFGLGVALTTPLLVVRWPLLALVDIVRSTPTLVLLLASNYFLPVLLNRPDMGAFTLALIALTVNLAAFIADVVRGAIANVPRAELDAARAVGLSETQILFHFTIPSVVRIILPTLALLYLAIVKNSSLASVIAVYELTHTGGLIIAERYRALEVYAVITAFYIALIMPLTLLARRLESTAVFGVAREKD